MKKEFYLRVRYRPTAKHFRLVRLTGWKEAGQRGWRQIGPGMPDCLKNWLEPCMVEAGWKIGAKLPSPMSKRFLKAMKQGSIVKTGPMTVIEADPGFSPVMEKMTWNTRAKLIRLYGHYRLIDRPAITVPPEPADFFEQVKHLVRTFRIISGDAEGEGWLTKTIHRVGQSNDCWSVALSMPETGEYSYLTWTFAKAADLKRWPEVRDRVSPAWDEALSHLHYCLWCMETKEDPLRLWPRFRGDKVTSQTLSLCLNTAKHYAKACWHMANHTDKAWGYV
jgi:hypothetical protein